MAQFVDTQVAQLRDVDLLAKRASAGLQSGRVRIGFRGTSANQLITRMFLAWWSGLSTGSVFCCKTESFLFTIRFQFTRRGRAVYVCLCNCVTDQQLVEAAAEIGCEPAIECSASLAEQIVDRLGAGLGCGSCREFALDLVTRAATRQGSVVLPQPHFDLNRTHRLPAGDRESPFQHAASRNHDALAYQEA